MFNQLLRFEISYLIKQPSFFISSLFIFIFAFCFSAVEDMTLGQKNIFINASYNITNIHLAMGMFCSIAIVSFIAGSALRNTDSKMMELVGAKPMHTLQYNLAKFLGAYLVVLLVFMAIPLGYMLGTWMPWLQPERLSVFDLGHYYRAFLTFTAPTVFFLCCVFYAVALRTRASMPVYMAAIAILVLYLVSGTFLRDLESQTLAAILDPFGFRAFSEIARYWSVEQQNYIALPLSTNLLINRALWLAIGVGVLMLFGKLTTRVIEQREKKMKKSTAKKIAVEKQYQSQLLANFHHTKVHKRNNWQILLGRIAFECKQIFTTPSFFILLTISVLFLLVTIIKQTGWFGTTALPITDNMLDAITGSFAMLSLVIVTFYSAEVVWRERAQKIADIVDSKAVSNVIFWTAKFVAVNFVLISIYALAAVVAIVYQLTQGVTDIELGQYLIRIGFFALLPLSMAVVLSFLIQTLVSNKYLGMLLFILVNCIPVILIQLGFEHHMFHFTSAPILQYSDMNGFAWYLQTQGWYMLYWGAFTLLLALAAFGLWVRGSNMQLKDKITQLTLLFSASRTMQVSAGLAVVIFVSSGSYIHYNTRVLNDYYTSEQTLDLLEAYERQYADLLDAPIPTITKVLAKVDLYPSQRRLDSRFEITIENKSQQAIKEFIVLEPAYAKDWDVKISGGELTHQEPIKGVAKFVFEQALQPGEQRLGEISVTRHHQGFKNAGFDTTLVKNGTFLNNRQMLPSFGVSKGAFLSDPNERRERDLPELALANSLEDTEFHNQSYMGKGMDFIEFEAQLSTEEGQTAIAPGYLVNQWVADGRHHFHYKMDNKIKNFYSILSAKLEVKKAQHNGVNIEVYHHAAHHKNIDLMIDAVKASLDYLTTEFGPYQHKQMRIIEFPSYRSFAQSFANTVPYSESMGFITDVTDEDKVNVPFLVTAHEVAHQWWGHQVGGADAEGSALLSESLSEYSALKIVEHTFGKAVMGNYLKRELDYYLAGRSRESREENPLIRTAAQQYLHYSKGGLVMMALADKMGEAKVNAALRQLLQDFQYQTSPYPTSLDLVAALESQATESQLGFIRQQFTEINLYDLQVLEATTQVLPDGQYQTQLTISAERRIADGKGKESPVDFADEVTLVLTASDEATDLSADNLLYQQRFSLTKGNNQLTIMTKEKPSKVNLDPYSNFVDTVKKDNIKSVKVAAE